MNLGALLIVMGIAVAFMVLFVGIFIWATYSTGRGQKIEEEPIPEDEIPKEWPFRTASSRPGPEPECFSTPPFEPLPGASFCDPKAAGKTPGCFNPHPPVDDAPRLGCATTGELLDELTARFQVHCEHGLEYKTHGMEAE